jgi:anti-sigma28 factor (negative regulator of flagellin synthesis)
MTKLNSSLKIDQKNSINKEFTRKQYKNNIVSGKENNSDRVSLSKTYKGNSSTKGREIASDIRYDLVKKYREVLADGSYKVKSTELADKMVQKVKENKNPVFS